MTQTQEQLDYSFTDELSRENLLKNEDFLNDARLFLIDRDGYSAKEVQNDEDVYDAFLEHFRYQNVNEFTATRDLIYAQSQADDEGRARMGRLMNTFDRMDSELGWQAAGDYLAGVFTAPSTYAGIFSFGAGKAGALAAQQGIKFGIRQALKSGGLKAGLGSTAVDVAASAGTIAAQEQTRVETIEGKDAIDWTNVGTGAAISAVASGTIGAYTGSRSDILNYGAETAKLNTLAKEKELILKAHEGATKNVLLAEGAESLSDAERKLIQDSAKDYKKKLSLKETIPDILEEGKKLKEEIRIDEVYGVKSKGMGLSLDEKHLENISAAGARIYHLIEPRFLDDGTQVVKGSKEDLQERFTSRIARGLTSGSLSTDKFSAVLREHNVSIEELGYLYAEEISEAASKLGKQSKIKRQMQKQLQKEMTLLDEKLMNMGDLTSKARKKANEQSGLNIMGFAGKSIVHLDKARIGLMTVQLATTARNTTNGYMRNYVYAFDNLGAGLYNLAKGGVKRIKAMGDEDLIEESKRAVRMGQRQLRVAGQSVLLDDLRLGTTSVRTQAAYNLFTDERFGKSDLARELFREMGDVGTITGTEGGLIGLARFFNGLNTKSDNMFKRAIFARELDKQIFSETGSSLEEVIKAGSFRSINDKTIAKAMDTALDFTYQSGKFKGKGGAVNSIFDTFIKVFSTPGLSLAVPFPRYMVNQLRFIYEHTPVVGMINFGGILNKTDNAERVGKQLGGLVTLYAMMQMRAIHGDETTGAFEYNTPQIGPLKSNGFYDARANLGPFSAFAVAADYFYKMMDSVDETTFKINIGDTEIDTFIKQNPRIANDVGYSSRDLVYAFTGGQGRGGTGLQFIDAVLDAGMNGIDISEDKYREYWVRAAADAINTATVGAGVIKDAVALIDPDFRKIPDNTDISLMGYFMKQATRSFPQTTDPNVDGIQLPFYQYKGIGGQRTGVSESPTRSGGKLMTNPLLKQMLGLSEQEEKTKVEGELKRLNLDYFEYAPRKIKLDASLGNLSKKFMAEFVENQITSFISEDYYQNLPSDFDKKTALKAEIYKFRALARQRALDPKRALNELEVFRIHRAMYYDLPKQTQKWLDYRYREELKKDGWDGNPTPSISGKIAKDKKFIYAFSFLEDIKESDTKLYEYYTRPSVKGVIKPLPQQK